MQAWQTSPLASVCTFFGDGDWIESKDQSPTGVRLVQTGNVGEGEFKDRAEKARFISQETFKQLRCTEIFPGDCLISRLPDPVGRACLVPETGERMITAVDCTIVRFDQSKVLPQYFAYYSQSGAYLAALDREATGTTRKRISRARLAQVSIPVAPLAEQRRLVALLDEAFEGIATAKANAEKNLQNARELFENELEAKFSSPVSDWRAVTLQTIGTTLTGSTPKTSEPENLGDYVPFVKPGDFNRDGSIDFDNEGLSEVGAKKARLVPEGSVLMVCIGATIGKAGHTDRQIATNQQVNSWTPNSSRDVCAKFIYYQMTTNEFQRRVRQNAGQATLPIINKAKWSALSVRVPSSIEEQLSVVRALDRLLAESARLESIYERKLIALDELKQSLLHQAFSGAL